MEVTVAVLHEASSLSPRQGTIFNKIKSCFIFSVTSLNKQNGNRWLGLLVPTRLSPQWCVTFYNQERKDAEGAIYEMKCKWDEWEGEKDVSRGSVLGNPAGKVCRIRTRTSLWSMLRNFGIDPRRKGKASESFKQRGSGKICTLRRFCNCRAEGGKRSSREFS